MNGLAQDLRYATRMLVKNPGFTAVVVIAIGLGIGVTTMIYSTVMAVLAPQFPFPDPDRLVVIEAHGSGNNDPELMSAPDVTDLRERSKTMASIAAWYESSAYLTLGTEPEKFNSAGITPGLLKTLGIAPRLGREFLPEESELGKQFSSVIISHSIWTRRLHSDPNILGKTFRMNGRVRTVVGVMAQGVRFPETADFWIPTAFDPKEDTRDSRYYFVVGRVKPELRVRDAAAEMRTLSDRIARENPGTNQGLRFTVEPYVERQVKDARPPMIMLMASVVFVLLIACANVANLMLARATKRQRELSLRAALGAGRGRIARQLLTESVLVALAGGVLGVLIAYWSNDFMLSTIPIEFPYWMKFGIDLRALGFTALVAVGSGLLFGMAPVLQLARGTIHESLKEGGTQMSAGRGHHRMRNALVISEIALSLVLLAGGGLMIRSFMAMQQQGQDLDPQNVLVGRVTLPVAVYEKDADRRAFFREMQPRIAALPGVVAASATVNVPLGTNSWSRRAAIEGKEREPETQWASPQYAPTLPGYFATLHIPFLQGRDFTPADRESTPRVAIVNEAAARQLWGKENPVGKRFTFGAADTMRWTTVIGVVGNVRQNVRKKDRLAQIYVPHAQQPVQTMAIVVRTRGDAAAVAAPIRRLLRSRDADLPFYDARTLVESIHYSTWEPRIYAQLMGSFAFIALVIAAVGIYGVMAYNVAQRTQEIGIRMAMGAAQGTVLRMVIGQGMRLTAFGLGIGLAIAFAVTRLMASLLFGVDASDPPTFVGVIAILAGSALLACWLPALRATRVDPMVALRSE